MRRYRNRKSAVTRRSTPTPTSSTPSSLNAGLLLEVRVEAELAAVLAHEYAHVMLGHVEKKTRNAMAGMAIASGLAGIYAAKTGANPEAFAESWQRAGALAGSRAYSPEMEIEADRLAVYILKEAGYPPTAMRDVIVRMHRIVPARRRGAFSPKRVGFLETHPSNDRRIAHILSAIRDAKGWGAAQGPEELIMKTWVLISVLITNASGYGFLRT